MLTDFEQDYLDITDVRIAFLKAHWDRKALASYLDAHPVLQFDFDGTVLIDTKADPRAVQYALELNQRTLDADRLAMEYERWYMSHPSLNVRHLTHVLAVRDRAGQIQAQLQGPPA